MNLTIEMPFEVYRGFVNKFNRSSAEYRLLADAYVERRRLKGRSGIVAQITCEKEQAQQLLNTAVHACPEAAVAIADALSVPRIQ